MDNLYDDNIASNLDDLGLRVYTSNLLGKSDELVLHGGGNTSVKSVVDGEDILFVKGSGWDLVSIEKEGFAPVELKFLQDVARVDELSDTNMVIAQKKAMIDKTAPNPSVEAILHAIIPFKFVDHTHSDAVVTISNNIDGKENIKSIYPNFLIVDYIMPGFILAHKVWELTKDLDWSECEGIILHNHGIFTFDDDAKKSYTKMIDAVSLAEEFLETNAPLSIEKYIPRFSLDIDILQESINKAKGYDVVMKVNQSPLALHYTSSRNLKQLASRGVLTPEHIIRTKRVPLILEDNNIQKAMHRYIEDYIEYFNEFKSDEVMLNPAPNYAVVKNFGVISFGKSEKEVNIIDDIISHTIKAVLRSDILGGYESISLKDSFDMEYWELEQNKLK
ncbi:MAG: class II aldolase/adducin family protein [Campylobacterota bacterium]|nr:class II aldolase/adducin family protein [Campylobacterota bacterium]